MEKINVGIIGSGHVFCRSKFYTVADILPSFSTSILTSGENKMVGEIDSGIWAISYMLSMYGERKEDFCLWEPPRLMINDKEVSISEFCEEACYMDTIYSLFSSTKTVEELVKEGIKKQVKQKLIKRLEKCFISFRIGLKDQFVIREMSFFKRWLPLVIVMVKKFFVFLG